MHGLWICLICILVDTGLTFFTRHLRKRAKKVYVAYDAQKVSGGMTGKQFAEKLVADYDICYAVQPIQGMVSDNFSPNEPRFSMNVHVCSSCSVLALAVAAHDTAHVLQYMEHPFGYRLWNYFCKVIRWAPWIGIPFLLWGFPLSFVEEWKYIGLIIIGMFLRVSPLLFHLLTLPMQYGANRRAKRMLADGGDLTSDEIGAANEVLRNLALQWLSRSPWKWWMKKYRRDAYGERAEYYREFARHLGPYDWLDEV